MMNKKNILIALPNDMLGGAEQFLRMIALAYAQKGYQVHVFFITMQRFNGWTGLPENVTLHYGKGGSERKGALSFMLSLYRYRKINFERVFTSHTHLTGMLGLLRKWGIVKTRYFIGRESTSIFKRFTGVRLAMFRMFYNQGYESLDLLICQTEFMKQQLMEGIPRIVARLNVVVIRNPVDLEEIACRSLETIALRSNYIVSAGRLIPEKGFDILINSFYSIQKEFPELELLILGEGPLRPALEKQVAQLGLTGKVGIPGRVENVYPYFKMATQCVVSSRVEGFPNVLLQMMSQNSNVVSTLCAGGIDKIPALPVCVPNDWTLLADLMLQSLKAGPATYAQRRQAFDGYLNSSSLDTFVANVEEMLNDRCQQTIKTNPSSMMSIDRL